MTTYTYSQLEALWLDAAKGTKYATAAWAALMAAIAEAESGGRDNAYNPSGASGLWQILGAVHGADQAHLFDPRTNAHEALLKLQSQGLGAWVTYTSGAYRQYLRPGVSPSSLPTSAGAPASSGTSGAGGGGISGAIADALGWPGKIIGFASDLDDALGKIWHVLTALFNPATWVRVAAGLGGLVLLGFGLFALFKAVA